MTIYDMYDHLKRTQSAATIKFHLPLARTSFFLPETDNVSTYSSARFALQIGPLAFRRSVFFGKLLLMDPSSIKQLISSLGIIKEWVPSTRCWARPKDPRLRCRGRCPEPWPRCRGDRRLGHHRRVAGRSLGRRLRRWRLLLFGLEGDGRQGRIAGQHGTGLLQDLPQDGKMMKHVVAVPKAPFESI